MNNANDIIKFTKYTLQTTEWIIKNFLFIFCFVFKSWHVIF